MKLGFQSTALLAAVTAMGLTAASARAVSVTPTDFNTLLNIGNPVAGPTDTNFFGAPPAFNNLGSLRSQVYFNSTTNVYTYAYQVTAGTNKISKFSTGFAVNNFNNVAGYNFIEAVFAGSSSDSNAFNIDYNVSNKQLMWTTNGNWFNRGDVLTFFFQTQTPPNPTPVQSVDLVNDEPGSADTFIPNDVPSAPAVIPEPASLAMLALGGLALLGRRSRR